MSEQKTFGDPDLLDVLEATKREVKTTLNAVNIGRIEAFNAAKQTATIQIQLQQITDITPNGTKTIQEHPVILECPCVTLFGGNSFMNMPIAPGDTCIVFFNDREIDNWLYNGGLQLPTSRRVHDVNDAIALVGIRHYQNSIADFLANGIRISFSSNSRIDLTTDAINSIAALWTHQGSLRVNGNFYVTGTMYGENGSQLRVNTDIIQQSGKVLAAGNGATGNFERVTVVNGIVTGGS